MIRWPTNSQGVINHLNYVVEELEESTDLRLSSMEDHFEVMIDEAEQELDPNQHQEE